jgi:hypothetical protein
MSDIDQDAPSLRTASLMRLSLDALAARSLKLVSMFLLFALCAAALARPSWVALSVCGVFAAVVVPSWWRRERRQGD